MSWDSSKRKHVTKYHPPLKRASLALGISGIPSNVPSVSFSNLHDPGFMINKHQTEKKVAPTSSPSTVDVRKQLNYFNINDELRVNCKPKHIPATIECMLRKRAGQLLYKPNFHPFPTPKKYNYDQ